MKKNDTFGYLAYALMLALAVCIGFFVLRPDFASGASYLTMNVFLLVFLSILVGIVFTSLLLELGHLLGAKIGHYEVTAWICLGIGFKKNKDGKKKFFLGSFDGLTGETIVTPKDTKKSNPRISIYMALLFLLLEIVIVSLLLVFGLAKVKAGETGFYWIKPASEVVLTIIGMILVYDIFPAPLDAKNDGYLITILNSKINVIAYNEMLLADDKLSRGLPVGDLPVYDEVTDFTYSVNDVTLYADLNKEDYGDALAILEKTLASKDKISTSLYRTAEAQKIAILLYTKPLEEAKTYYIALPLDVKKHLSALNSAPAIRAYVLANGLIEESIGETEAGLNKVHDVFRKLPKEKKAVEKKLLKQAMERILVAHPDWDFSDYGYTLEKSDEASDITKEKKDDNN